MALDQIDVDEYDAQMSFLEHLEALRWHLVRSLVAVVVGAIFSFINGRFIFDKILLGSTKPNFWTYQKMCELSQYLIKTIGFVLTRWTLSCKRWIFKNSSINIS